MTAAKGGIVVQDEVALMDIIAEIGSDRLHGGDQRPEMDRNVLTLKDHLGDMVEERGRVVMRVKTLDRAVFSSDKVISRWVVSSIPRITERVIGSTLRAIVVLRPAGFGMVDICDVKARRRDPGAAV
jgi:hypothetical protein